MFLFLGFILARQKRRRLTFFNTALETTLSKQPSSAAKMAMPKYMYEGDVALGGLHMFNIAHGYSEAQVRGMRSGFLSESDYSHLTQCESMEVRGLVTSACCCVVGPRALFLFCSLTLRLHFDSDLD